MATISSAQLPVSWIVLRSFPGSSPLYSKTVLGAALIRSKSVICWMIRSMASFLALFVEVKYFWRMVWNSLTACTHTAFSSAENGMGS